MKVAYPELVDDGGSGLEDVLAEEEQFAAACEGILGNDFMHERWFTQYEMPVENA